MNLKMVLIVVVSIFSGRWIWWTFGEVYEYRQFGADISQPKVWLNQVRANSHETRRDVILRCMEKGVLEGPGKRQRKRMLIYLGKTDAFNYCLNHKLQHTIHSDTITINPYFAPWFFLFKESTGKIGCVHMSCTPNVRHHHIEMENTRYNWFVTIQDSS